MPDGDIRKNTPLIDAMLEREPILPRGPIRSQIATREFAVQFTSLTASSLIQSLVKAYMRGGLGGMQG